MAERLWICTRSELVLTSGDVGVASQKFTNITQSVVLKVDRQPIGYTCVKQYLRAFYFQEVAASTPVSFLASMGLIRVTGGVDVGDFPDLATHTGDLLMHDCRPLFETAAIGLVVPSAAGEDVGANMKKEGRSQRKMVREDDTLALYLQKSLITEQNIHFLFALTCLWVRSG